MLRYVGAAAVANVFSMTPATLRSYRKLANEVETRRRIRTGLPEPYVERVSSLFAIEDHYLRIEPGDAVLEIGTGWVHWESLILTLITNAEFTMTDVVDSRLFPVFKLYAAALRPQLDDLGLPAEKSERAEFILDVVQKATSFEEVYDALSWTYVVDATGTMDVLPSGKFDFITSSDVLEHIDRKILGTFLKSMYRLLRPGCYAYHSIDLMDHLSYYDPKASMKLYYRFDGARWDRWINSKVQYINRIQRPEWLALFEDAGFE
jgi:SAM-dependent methyltransferase